MKAISLIWILSMLLMGFAAVEDMTPLGPDTAMETCGTDHCCEHACCCLPDEDGKDQDVPGEDEGCRDECHCHATAHFLAIQVPENEGRSYSAGHAFYGNYVNQYHFEFLELLFQPPRLM